MTRKAIKTDGAPKAIAAYSQGILAEGKYVFVSGQVGIDPQTGAMAGDDVASQARQCLENLKAILSEAGSSLEDVVKVTVYLKTIADYAAVNEIYAQYFNSSAPPARAAFGGLELPAGAQVEIECIAIVPD